jgi:hypothetical protein
LICINDVSARAGLNYPVSARKDRTMSEGESIYLIGVIVAFAAFAVTLAVVSFGQHLPPVGTGAPTKGKWEPARH